MLPQGRAEASLYTLHRRAAFSIITRGRCDDTPFHFLDKYAFISFCLRYRLRQYEAELLTSIGLAYDYVL